MNQTSEGEPLARCRWHDGNDVPMSKMAIGHYRPDGKFSGICEDCVSSEKASEAYVERVLRNGIPAGSR